MQSLQAHLLVASPKLPDANFDHTVVLMIQHDEDGAFGVVLNRPTPLTVREVWEQATHEPCDNDECVSVGGPVPGPLIAVHTSAAQGESEILPGLYLATQKENLDLVVQPGEHRCRLFTGYSGWGAGQLEGEIEAGGWLTTAAKLEHVFSDAETLWKQVADAIGRAILFPGKTNTAGGDPGVN